MYARLTDSSGRTVEAQDDILVSASAQPASTASDLTPPVQTVSVTGPGGTTQQMTVYRQTFIVPPNAALTTTPCPGTLTGCMTMSSASGTAGAAIGPGPLPATPPGAPGGGPAAVGNGGAFGAAPSPPLPGPPAGPVAVPSGNCPITRAC